MATFVKLIQEMQAFLGDESALTQTNIKTFINDARREIWYQYPWPFRRFTYTFNTAAPYNTGTITATKGSTTISIAGGSLTGLEGYKFSLGTASPFYRIISVVGGGASATLENAYSEATITTSTFFIYKDEYELPTYIKSVANPALLLKQGYPRLEHVPQDTIASLMSTPRIGQMVPRWFNTDGTPHSFSTSQQAINFRLAPVPNDTYPIELVYLRSIDDLINDDDVIGFPDEFLPCIKNLSLYKAYQLDYQHQPESALAFQAYQGQFETLKDAFKYTQNHQWKFKRFDLARRPFSIENNALNGLGW